MRSSAGPPIQPPVQIDRIGRQGDDVLFDGQNVLLDGAEAALEFDHIGAHQSLLALDDQQPFGDEFKGYFGDLFGPLLTSGAT